MTQSTLLSIPSLARVAFLCLLAVPIMAQAPILSASGTLVATYNSATQQVGPGPIPAAGAQAYSPGAGASHALSSVFPLPTNSSTPGAAGIGLAITGFGSAPFAGTYSVSSDVLLTLAPIPIGTAVLQVQWTRDTTGVAAATPLSVSIDVGDDGSNEFTASLSGWSPQVTSIRELGLPVAAGGMIRVRQTVAGSGSVGRSRLDLQVFPAASPVDAGAAGCFALTHRRPAAGTIELICSPPSGSPTIFLFGTAPLAGTLPWAPACPLLLQLSTMIPAPVVGGVATLAVADAVLPPGFTYYTQAISVVNSNDVRSTGALVMRGM